MSDQDVPHKKNRMPLYVTLAVLCVVVIAVLLYLFQPWALFTNKQVNEDLPTSLPSTASASPSGSPSGSASPTAATNTTLASGQFVSFEHETTGTASLIRLADGRTIVRLSNFKTSNGPDVKVWLSVNPASKAKDARSGKYVNLGDLKGNVGNQNYDVPVAAAGETWNSVVIWCDRFSVPFGAANLKPVAPSPRS